MKYKEDTRELINFIDESGCWCVFEYMGTITYKDEEYMAVNPVDSNTLDGLFFLKEVEEDNGEVSYSSVEGKLIAELKNTYLKEDFITVGFS